MSRKKTVVDLLAGLVDPRLTGAACAGQGNLWDDILDDDDDEASEDREARHHRARTICRRCPVQAECETAASEHDSTGIWNGRLQGPAATQTRRTAP